MSVNLEIRQNGGVHIMDASGRIVLGDGAGELRDALRQMTASGQKHVLLNMAQVTYLDSSGLGALVSSGATLTNAGGELKLLNVTNRVRDLLLVTKLYTVFQVFDDETAAVNSFAATAATR